MLPILSFILFNSSVVLLFVNQKYKRKYIKVYKDEIISNFIKGLYPNLTYKTTEAYETLGIEARKSYEKANFDGRTFNRFFTDDYIQGNTENDVKFQMCDINVQQVTRSGKHTNVETLFQGMFAYMDCKKTLNTYIRITNKNVGNLDESIMNVTGGIFKGNDRVETDHAEFEEIFNVYSEDKILTLRLLTTDTMEYLAEFYKKLKFEIVIKENHIFFRFFTGPMFEPKIFGKSMDKEYLFTCYSALKFMNEITNRLNKLLEEVEL